MEHTVFAIFSNLPQAERAVETLLSSDLSKDHHVSVVVHRSVDPERLDALIQGEGDSTETDGAPSAMRGALIGGIVGAAIAGPLGLIGAGPLASLLFGAWVGAAQGALAGGLIGAGLTDSTLQRLAEHLKKGDTLVTVHADGREREAAVESLLEQHGAHVVEKRLFTTPPQQPKGEERPDST